MERYIKPLATAVTLLLLAGAGALLFRSGDGGTYQVTAYFEKAIGLFPNSDVNILGVPVGKVRSVEPEGSRVKVVMDVSDGYKVPADAFAQIVPISVIADRFVQLHPPYTDGPVMEDGAVLETDRTQIPAELDDVFKQLKKLLEAIEPGEEGEPGALGELIVQLDQALNEQGDELKGAVVNTAALTETLAGAEEDISDLLINLDNLFGTLAQRAGNIGSLNRNFAIVMSTLAESSVDLQGTLANLADMTGEVGRTVSVHRERLGDDLALASRILSTVLKNRSSVEETLTWLPVVGIGATNAYNPQSDNIDVRDNGSAKLKCDVLDPIPDNPLKDALEQLCKEQTGEPPPEAAVVEQRIDRQIDCKEGTRKVKKQLIRLQEIDLPASVLEGVVRPMEKKLRELARECKKLGRQIRKEGGLLDDLREGVGELPVLDDTVEDLGGLTGTAAGPAGGPVPTESPSIWDGFASWLRGFRGFLGWSS